MHLSNATVIEVGPGAQSRRRIGWIAALGLTAAALFLTGAEAQEGGGIVAPGSAVVTGFSGYTTNEAPGDEDPFDYLTINPDGPAAQVIDLSSLGPQGGLSEAAKTFTVSASQVGQVFGVAVDNAPQPNIYLAASSLYGVSIYLPDGSETIRRIRSGAPGAQFVPGQFGPPEWGGGPGSIWRVDGTTGETYLFATIDSAATGVASLGGLAFDPASQQLFAVSRSTGVIHRFSLDGTELGSYDHGVEGRPAAGLSPLPFVPPAPVDIGSAAFDTENPGTWGLASPARRVLGLAVRNNRLYYSVAQGPQIWSVGIGANGALSAAPRIEVDSPALLDGVEIGSIAFDGSGRMYLAERGPTTGDYELIHLAAGGQARVLRFIPKQAGDPAPGLWRLAPDQYAIGMPAPYNNANGGVALGYGYQPSGAINFGACRATVWSTGERLLDPGDPSVPVDSYPAVDGLQGNSPSLIEPQNEPPTSAWFVDYDDLPGSPEYTGYMGAIAIYSPCVGGGAYVPPPPVVTCPPGTVYQGGQCVVTVTCPPGTTYKNGVCIYVGCPAGYVLYKGQCVPPPLTCPPGFAFYDGQCVPLSCPPGMKRMPNGQCICPVDNIFYNGKCVPPSYCPPGMVQYPNGVCWCPLGSHFANGICIPNKCPKGLVPFNGKCVPEYCPPGYQKGPGGFCVEIVIPCSIFEILINGQCLPKQCPAFQELGKDGKCHPIFIPCGPGNIIINGKCVPKKCPPFQEIGKNGKCQPIVIIDCGKGTKLVNGKCVPIVCKANQKLVNGQCVPMGLKPADCDKNEKFINGKCVPIVCKANEKLVNGQCVATGLKPSDCGKNEKFVNGKCVPEKKPDDSICPPGRTFINGKCVLDNGGVVTCGAGEQLKNGKCVKVEKGNNNNNKDKNICPPGRTFINGKCVLDNGDVVTCGAGEQLKNGKCVKVEKNNNNNNKDKNICPPGRTFVNGKCVQDNGDVVTCGAGEQLKNGKCVKVEKDNNGNNNKNKNICPPGRKFVDGKCVEADDTTVVVCKKGEELKKGKCVKIKKDKSICPPGRKFVDGKCVAE